MGHLDAVADPGRGDTVAERVWRSHARWQLARVAAFLAAVALLLALVPWWERRARARSEARQQQVVSLYTPGIRVREPTPAAALVPYGFRRGRDGYFAEGRASLRDGLVIDELSTTLAEAPPRYDRSIAPLWELTLRATNADAAARIETTLRATLGRPTTDCTVGARRTLTWDGDGYGGTRLVLNAAPSGHAAELTVGQVVSAASRFGLPYCRDD